MSIKRNMNREDLARALAEYTGFYIKNCRDIVDALGDIILDNMKMARMDKNSSLCLAPGVYIGGKRKERCESIDPRNRESIITPEKVIPYAEFKPSIRLKLYTEKKGYEKVRYNNKRRKNANANNDTTGDV